MKTDTFDMYFKKKTISTDKGGKTYKNIRNMIAGQLNAKPASINRTVIHHSEFVVYEYIDGGDGVQNMTAQEQLEEATRLGFEVVSYEVFPAGMTLETLSAHLKEQVLMGDYEIDGIIVANNTVRPDRSDLDAADNPHYAIAFKENANGILVEVNEVTWQIGRDGRINPVVTFDPVWLDAEVSKASAYNAKFIKDNKIGPGANIRIIRSGGVIPKINEVIFGTEAQYPDEDYEWGKKGTFIFLVDKETDEVTIKKLYSFLDKIEVKDVGLKSVEKIYDEALTADDYHGNLVELMELESDDLRSIPRFGKKTCDKVVNAIQGALATVDFSTFAVATGILGSGVGRRKFRPVVEKYYHKLKAGEPLTENMLSTINGLGEIYIPLIAANWVTFMEFWETDVPEGIRKGIYQTTEKKPEKKATAKDHADLFTGEKILLTGFRDKKISELIEGHETNGLTKSVTLLIVKDISTCNKKTMLANANSIPIMTKEEFYEKFSL